MKIHVSNLDVLCSPLLFGAIALITGISMHSMEPVFFDIFPIAFTLFFSYREWKNHLYFDTQTEEIFCRNEKFSVYDILEIKDQLYYKSYRMSFILPDRRIICNFSRFAYNMKYFRMFLEAHEIKLQEEQETWH